MFRLKIDYEVDISKLPTLRIEITEFICLTVVNIFFREKFGDISRKCRFNCLEKYGFCIPKILKKQCIIILLSVRTL